MFIAASAPPIQLASASRPPGVPTKLRCTTWAPLWPKKTSQRDQDFLDDEFGYDLRSTTSPLLLHKVVVPRRKKQVSILQLLVLVVHC